MKKDLTGQRYGKLVVIRECDPHYPSTYPVGKRCRRWLCQCDCGNEAKILQASLVTGNTKSCGCGCLENKEKILVKAGSVRCKYPNEKKLRAVFVNIKQRCSNPKSTEYERYGGRGIKVCDEWLQKDGTDAFCEWALSNGYKDGLTIDRIDNDKGYSPDNCRWIDRFEQMSNTSMTKKFEYNGEMLSAPQIARLNGHFDKRFSRVLYQRLKAGWEIETALNTPIKERKTGGEK